jgi:hypothetical protein
MKQELVKMEPDSLPSPNVADMLQAVIKGGVTAESVGALEKLAMLYERMQDKEAEKQFAAAFVALQAEMPIIVAESVIPNRGKYAKFEHVMNQIKPLLQKHGFSLSFSNQCVENRVIETCHLKHIGGHSQSNSFAVRVGKADSETQADCKAATTAKRNALLNALNIVISQDILNEEHDASIEGDPYEFVTKEQAGELERRVAETNSDKTAFLKFANSEKFATIQSNRYHDLDAMLTRKERAGR